MHTTSRNLFTDGVNSFCHALLGALIHWNFSLDTSLHIFYCSKEIVLYPNPAGHPYPVFEPLKLFYETISINRPGPIRPPPRRQLRFLLPRACDEICPTTTATTAFSTARYARDEGIIPRATPIHLVRFICKICTTTTAFATAFSTTFSTAEKVCK